MNAEFFALAFASALNPKLLALDLLLIENRRPRAMFLCVLLGGMTVAVAIGLLDVLTVHADAISSQGKASAGVDLALALGLLLLVGPDLPVETRKKRVDAEALRLSDLGATLLSDLGEELQEGVGHYAVALKDPEGNEFDVN
jgi:hypothetical protein